MSNTVVRETAAVISRISRVLGAEVTGVDIRKADEPLLIQLRDALLRHGVLVIRDQHLAPADQVEFLNRLYPMRFEQTFMVDRTTPGVPAIGVLSNIVEDGKPIGVADSGLLWHSDGSFVDSPELFVCVYAIEVPVRDGKPLGATRFINVAAAFEALPQQDQQMLATLTAVQSYAHHFEKMKQFGHSNPSYKVANKVEDRVQPVVRVHPITGRRCLFINDGFTARIEGMSREESDELMSRLFAHMTSPEFLYEHQWRENDLVIWDNALTQHQGTADYGDLRRLMHRCVTTGPPVSTY
jgi:taurine dioxygenase